MRKDLAGTNLRFGDCGRVRVHSPAMERLDPRRLTTDHERNSPERTPGVSGAPPERDARMDARSGGDSIAPAWIERLESRGRELYLSTPQAPGTPPAQPPKDLQGRLEADFEIFRSAEGLRPDAWAKAGFEERLETLRHVEMRLAKAQDRDPFRTYAVHFKPPTDSPAHWTNAAGGLISGDGEQAAEKNFGEAKVISMDPAYFGSPLAWKGFAEGNYIRIESDLVRSESPWGAVALLAHESRHAFQWSVLSWHQNPNKAIQNKYSEVDALTLEKWQYGREAYGKTEYGSDAYYTNPLKVDSREYGAQVGRAFNAHYHP